MLHCLAVLTGKSLVCFFLFFFSPSYIQFQSLLFQFIPYLLSSYYALLWRACLYLFNKPLVGRDKLLFMSPQSHCMSGLKQPWSLSPISYGLTSTEQICCPWHCWYSLGCCWPSWLPGRLWLVPRLLLNTTLSSFSAVLLPGQAAPSRHWSQWLFQVQHVAFVLSEFHKVSVTPCLQPAAGRLALVTVLTGPPVWCHLHTWWEYAPSLPWGHWYRNKPGKVPV